MAKTKLNIIRPALGFASTPDADLLQRLNNVHDGMVNNPAYPTPPVDLATFKIAIDGYTAAVAALLNGGRAATVERDKRRTDVILMLRLLGHYVEMACKNDMSTFTSSGFTVATPVTKTPPQPVAVPTIGSVDQGSSGQLLVNVKPVAGARGYDIRYAAVPAAGGSVTWTSTLVPSTKPPFTLNNLNPGATYTFQVRAWGKLGFSDWSASVDRMVI